MAYVIKKEAVYVEEKRLTTNAFWQICPQRRVLHLGMFVYNCLRLIGQLGLTGDISPARHPAKRRRLRTVLQEVM